MANDRQSRNTRCRRGSDSPAGTETASSNPASQPQTDGSIAGKYQVRVPFVSWGASRMRQLSSRPATGQCHEDRGGQISMRRSGSPRPSTPMSVIGFSMRSAAPQTTVGTSRPQVRSYDPVACNCDSRTVANARFPVSPGIRCGSAGFVLSRNVGPPTRRLCCGEGRLRVRGVLPPKQHDDIPSRVVPAVGRFGCDAADLAAR